MASRGQEADLRRPQPELYRCILALKYFEDRLYCTSTDSGHVHGSTPCWAFQSSLSFITATGWPKVESLDYDKTIFLLQFSLDGSCITKRL